MKLIINGETVDKVNAETITELLSDQKVKMPEYVSVELNGTILKRADFDVTPVTEGDTVEFMYFMGGGGDGFN